MDRVKPLLFCFLALLLGGTSVAPAAGKAEARSSLVSVGRVPLSLPEEILPGMLTDFFRVTTTLSESGDLQFHVVFETERTAVVMWNGHKVKPSKVIEETMVLAKLVPDPQYFYRLEDKAAFPKIRKDRRGGTVTADFTLPRNLINEPDLVLYFDYGCGPKEPVCATYYARLKKFVPPAPFPSSKWATSNIVAEPTPHNSGHGIKPSLGPEDPAIILDLQFSADAKPSGTLTIIESLDNPIKTKIEEASLSGSVIKFKTRTAAKSVNVASVWTGELAPSGILTLRRETQSKPTSTPQTFSLRRAK